MHRLLNNSGPPWLTFSHIYILILDSVTCNRRSIVSFSCVKNSNGGKSQFQRWSGTLPQLCRPRILSFEYPSDHVYSSNLSLAFVVYVGVITFSRSRDVDLEIYLLYLHVRWWGFLRRTDLKHELNWCFIKLGQLLCCPKVLGGRVWSWKSRARQDLLKMKSFQGVTSCQYISQKGSKDYSNISIDSPR